MICDICGQIEEDCECELHEDEDYQYFGDAREFGYDGECDW